MIVIEQAQLQPTVLYLSPWMQYAASTCVCVCLDFFLCPSVCVSLRDCVSLFAAPLAAGRCAVNCERQCECVSGIMKSSHCAVLPGSTVKPLRRSRVATAEPGAVITAALKQRNSSWGGKRVSPLRDWSFKREKLWRRGRDKKKQTKKPPQSWKRGSERDGLMRELNGMVKLNECIRIQQGGAW